jgi:hypothetical protein
MIPKKIVLQRVRFIWFLLLAEELTVGKQVLFGRASQEL